MAQGKPHFDHIYDAEKYYLKLLEKGKIDLGQVTEEINALTQFSKEARKVTNQSISRKYVLEGMHKQNNRGNWFALIAGAILAAVGLSIFLWYDHGMFVENPRWQLSQGASIGAMIFGAIIFFRAANSFR